MSRFLCLGLLLMYETMASAAESKPIYKWMAANDYYMILPTAQTLNISGGGSEIVKPWGFGFRAVGNNETISKTGGLQIQSIKVDNPHTGKDNLIAFFYASETSGRGGANVTIYYK